MSITKILKQSNWNEKSFLFEQADYVKKIKNKYATYSFAFALTDDWADQLAHLYNLKIYFNQNNESYYIKFDITKSIKYKQDYLNFIAEKLQERSAVHIADIHPGYYSVWLGESGKVYAEYETTIIFLGDTPFNSIQNLYQNKVQI